MLHSIWLQGAGFLFLRGGGRGRNFLEMITESKENLFHISHPCGIKCHRIKQVKQKTQLPEVKAVSQLTYKGGGNILR